MINLDGDLYDCATEEEAIAMRDFVPDPEAEAVMATLEAAIAYKQLRADKYNLLNQDEMRFDDLVNSTTTWHDAIVSIKLAHPKP